MYYFKMIGPHKPENSGFFSTSTKHVKPVFSKQNISNINVTSTQTPPAMLFVNLLMKHGKKTRALRVLEQTLFLFKTKISKIKLVPDPKKKPFHFGYNVHLPPWFSLKKDFKSSYSIKPYHFITILSTKKGITFINSILYKPLFKYRNSIVLTPLNFCFLGFFFYRRRRFFRGKMLDLNQCKINDLSNQSFRFLLNPLKYPRFLLPCFDKKGSPIKSKKNPPFQKYLWYKSPVSSWDQLTLAQKNTFLYCLYKAISNVKPPVECRTKRLGGSNKQVPSQISEHRQWGIAIRWIIEAAFFKKKGDMFPMVVNQNRSRLFDNSKYSLCQTIGTPGDARFALHGEGTSKRNNKKKEENIRESKNQLSNHDLQQPPTSLAFFMQKSPCTSTQKQVSKESIKGFLWKERSIKKFYRKSFFLAESLENAYYKRGRAMQKRNVWIEAALANRAFLRYRWW